MCCDVQFTDYQCKLTAGCRAEPAKVGINTTIAFQAIVLDEMNNRLPTLIPTLNFGREENIHSSKLQKFKVVKECFNNFRFIPVHTRMEAS